MNVPRGSTAIGGGAASLLAVLELDEAERAAEIGRLQERWGVRLAEVLTDVESDPDDLVRLRLVAALREVLA